MIERVRKIDGVEIETPGGAFYAFPDVTKLCGGEKGGFVEGFGPVKGSDEMCRYLLQEARVALVPGSAFGVDECIRISYAASDESFVIGNVGSEPDGEQERQPQTNQATESFAA